MLCNHTLNGVVEAIRPLRLTPGKDFQIVTVSFDPREGPQLAKPKKANYVQSLGKPEAAAGWHFLSSSRPERARRLCEPIGFGYKLDPKGENYLHQAAVYVCTPGGRVARTIQGIKLDSEMLHDSLIKASAGKISSGSSAWRAELRAVSFRPGHRHVHLGGDGHYAGHRHPHGPNPRHSHRHDDLS